MKKNAALNMSYWDLVWPLAVGGGIGIGARLARWGLDLKNRGDKESSVPLSQIERAQIPVPVEVSSEEADELRRQGFEVKTAASTVFDTGLQGILGTAAAMGGWSLLDKYLDNQRKAKAEKSLERSRKRVENLIAGMPDDGDEGLGYAMKIAADIYEDVLAFHGGPKMIKTADLGSWFGQSVVNGVASALTPLGIPLGIGATVAATRAFNKSRERNKYRQRSKAIRDYVDELGAREPMAVLVPVERKVRRGRRPSENFTDEAGPDYFSKSAAERDDDGMSKWVWMALIGAAGAAGYFWVSQNPELVKQYVPEWGHDTVDWIASSVGNQNGVLPAEVKKAGAQIAQRAAEEGVPEAATAATVAGIQEDTGYTISPAEVERANQQAAQLNSWLFQQPLSAVMDTVSQRLGVKPKEQQAIFARLEQELGSREQAEIAFRDLVAREMVSLPDLLIANLVTDLQNPESNFAKHIVEVFRSTGRLPPGLEADPVIMELGLAAVGADPAQYAAAHRGEDGQLTPSSLFENGVGQSDYSGNSGTSDVPPGIDQATGMPENYYSPYSRVQPSFAEPGQLYGPDAAVPETPAAPPTATAAAAEVAGGAAVPSTPAGFNFNLGITSPLGSGPTPSQAKSPYPTSPVRPPAPATVPGGASVTALPSTPPV